MARNRDYDDGDFDQPKRSSPYQDMDGDEYDDDYADDYEDEDEYAASSVKKGARKGGGSAGGTVKILGGVIVLLVVILIALVVVRAVITNKRNANDGVKPSESVSTIPEQTTNPAPMVFGGQRDGRTDRKRRRCVHRARQRLERGLWRNDPRYGRRGCERPRAGRHGIRRNGRFGYRNARAGDCDG